MEAIAVVTLFVGVVGLGLSAFRRVVHTDRTSEWQSLARTLGLTYTVTDKGPLMSGRIDGIAVTISGRGTAGRGGGFGQVGGGIFEFEVGDVGLRPTGVDSGFVLESLEVIFADERVDNAPVIEGRELTGMPSLAVGDLSDDEVRRRLDHISTPDGTLQDGIFKFSVASDGVPRASAVRYSLSRGLRLAGWLRLSDPSLRERVLAIVGEQDVALGRKLVAVDLLSRAFEGTPELRATMSKILQASDCPQLVVALAQLSPRAEIIDRLVILACDDDAQPPQRADAIIALARFAESKSARLQQHVVHFLRASEPMEVRLAAAHALVLQGGSASADKAARALATSADNDELVEALLDTIRASGGPTHQQAVTVLLQSPKVRIQWLAVQALAEIGDSDIVAPLRSAADTSDRKLREFIHASIDRVQARLGLVSRPGALTVAADREGQLSYASASASPIQDAAKQADVEVRYAETEHPLR